jgi:hypothetical protein
MEGGREEKERKWMKGRMGKKVVSQNRGGGRRVGAPTPRQVWLVKRAGEEN